MHVVTVEKNIEQRIRLRFMLELTGRPYVLREVADIKELGTTPPDWGSLRLALVGAECLDDALKSIIYLRGRMPSGAIVAHCEADRYDSTTLPRLHAAGADIVLDPRFSPSKMAMICERFMLSAKPLPPPPNALNWRIQDAIRMAAPAAQFD